MSYSAITANPMGQIAVGLMALHTLLLLALPLPTFAQTINPHPDCESPQNTIEHAVCAGLALEQAEQQMRQYLDATMARWKHLPALSKAIAESQTRWEAYRDSHCWAVAELHAGGTIQGAAGTGCRTALTRARTRELWARWLHYLDSAPPLLPEPPADCDPWSSWGSGPCFRRRP